MRLVTTFVFMLVVVLFGCRNPAPLVVSRVTPKAQEEKTVNVVRAIIDLRNPFCGRIVRARGAK